MNIFETYVKFTDRDTVTYYSIYQLTTEDPYGLVGDMDEILYKKVGTGFGQYVPI